MEVQLPLPELSSALNASVPTITFRPHLIAKYHGLTTGYLKCFRLTNPLFKIPPLTCTAESSHSHWCVTLHTYTLPVTTDDTITCISF
jgi:hypothetical protein